MKKANEARYKLSTASLYTAVLSIVVFVILFITKLSAAIGYIGFGIVVISMEDGIVSGGITTTPPAGYSMIPALFGLLISTGLLVILFILLYRLGNAIEKFCKENEQYSKYSQLSDYIKAGAISYTVAAIAIVFIPIAGRTTSAVADALIIIGFYKLNQMLFEFNSNLGYKLEIVTIGKYKFDMPMFMVILGFLIDGIIGFIGSFVMIFAPLLPIAYLLLSIGLSKFGNNLKTPINASNNQ